MRRRFSAVLNVEGTTVYFVPKREDIEKVINNKMNWAIVPSMTLHFRDALARRNSLHICMYNLLIFYWPETYVYMQCVSTI